MATGASGWQLIARTLGIFWRASALDVRSGPPSAGRLRPPPLTLDLLR